MEQRKLIKLGNSSFAIALPKEWIDNSGLKKGDSVFVERNDRGEIILTSDYQKNDKDDTKILDFSEIIDEEVIQREITNAYIQGSNNFKIKGLKDKKRQNLVKEKIGYLVGFEIVDDNNGEITAKDFFDLEEVKLENFVRRIDNNIRSMMNELENGIKAGKIGNKQFNEIYEADHDVNKFYLLMTKIFIKSAGNPSALSMLKMDFLTMFNSWWLVHNLEHIGDEVKRIARYLKQDKLNSEKIGALSEVMAQLKVDYLESVNSYYSKDRQLALKVIARKDKTIKMADLLSQDKESVIAKTGEKIKVIRGELHQINKIILHSLAAG